MYSNPYDYSHEKPFGFGDAILIPLLYSLQNSKNYSIWWCFFVLGYSLLLYPYCYTQYSNIYYYTHVDFGDDFTTGFTTEYMEDHQASWESWLARRECIEMGTYARSKCPMIWITGWWFGTWILFFHSVGNNHPNWLSYFSEGLNPPTSIEPYKTHTISQVIWHRHLDRPWTYPLFGGNMWKLIFHRTFVNECQWYESI